MKMQKPNEIEAGILAFFGTQKRFKHEFLSAASGQYFFDIVKFDEWLHVVHGYREEEHGSMSDFIKLTWGERADNFIRSII